MNPNASVRPWLLAVGKQFGIRQAHDFHWPDADTRPKQMYCTYRLLKTVPVSAGHHNLSTNTGNTLHRKASKPYKTTVQIDLYNSQDGLYELAAMEVAAFTNPVIRNIFKTGGCAFKTSEITDETEFDAEVIDYHQRMVAVFEENVEVSLDEINGVVDEIELDLDFDGDIPEYVIDDTGIELK